MTAAYSTPLCTVLDQVGWSRTHDWSRSTSRPGQWFVLDDFTGSHVYAVTDDFGNLVRVP